MSRGGITISDSFHKADGQLATAYGEFVHSVVKPDYWITFNVNRSTNRETAEQLFKERIVAMLSRKRINTGWRLTRSNGVKQFTKVKLISPIYGFNQHIVYTMEYDIQPLKSLECQTEHWHFHVGLKFELEQPSWTELESVIKGLWDGDFHISKYRDEGATVYGYSKHRNNMIDLGCPRTGACNRNGRRCCYENSISSLLNGNDKRKSTV